MLAYHPERYAEQLAAKQSSLASLLAPFAPPAIAVFPSPGSGYRLRAEFRLWHEGEDLFYAMFDRSAPKTPLRVEHFPIASEIIQSAMPRLRAALLASPELRRKVFQVEFLSTLSGQLLVTLIYHRALDEAWDEAALALESQLAAHVIGRSRKQRRVMSRDYLEETLPLNQGVYHYRQYEQGFTQPNGVVNCSMINWACDQVACNQAAGSKGDLLELYCGNGNFTLPLAAHFDNVLATEVAKSSIRAALLNRELNEVDNLQIARLSAEEVSSALAGERQFKRLRALEKPLEDYRFSTVFVDPPRAGLDPATRALVGCFDRILYVSCNPHALARDLAALEGSHRLVSAALFDQFPYTDHIECGVLLTKP